jgi:trans-AT polyketide synthase/acyltransferase/oxidoreductase domain-containing protein
MAGSGTAWLFPGQGSQRRGMGAELISRFPEYVAKADSVLGYSLQELCQENPDNRLDMTQYTQPALFVVNALASLALAEAGVQPRMVAGHSLGEYNALFTAHCFDFETAVSLVQKRGLLMAEITGGGMTVVTGMSAGDVADLIARHGLTDLDVANQNSPTQLTISGPLTALRKAAEVLRQQDGVRCVPLNVSGPFHSRYMASAAERFERLLERADIADPRLPVVSNVTGDLYERGTVRALLTRQICEPVRWLDCMRCLREHGVTEVNEIGTGRILTTLWEGLPADNSSVLAEQRAAMPRRPPRPSADGPRQPAPEGAGSVGGVIVPEQLGSEDFRREYTVRYAYLAGSMYQGIASVDLVIRLGKAGLMGFFGAGGLRLADVAESIEAIQRELGRDGRYGVNLLYAVDDSGLEAATAKLYVDSGVRFVEAAGYTHVTPALVHVRFAGAYRDQSGRAHAPRHVLAKVSRPEVAAAFASPPSASILSELVSDGRLSPAEADAARDLPVSEDLCVESDSGGHTDGGVAFALLPAISRLRDEAMKRHGYVKRIRVGAAGGIGAPEAVAAAFILGADFIVTGSINQCSPEAGTSEAVKDILTGLDVQDTTYAPAGDMFEMGAKVQVVRKGTLFPARANRLYQLYRQHDCLEDLDQATRDTLEKTYFRRSFEDIWTETQNYLSSRNPAVLERAERNPKQRMAMVFKWYFIHSTRLALTGIEGERVNYQIHSGPAMGAFNCFLKRTDLEDWRNRHVEVIAERLMRGGANVLTERLNQLTQ